MSGGPIPGDAGSLDPCTTHRPSGNQGALTTHFPLDAVGCPHQQHSGIEGLAALKCNAAS